MKVDEAVLTLLQDSMKYMEKNPKFDITEGKVLSLWHDAREAETPMYLPTKTFRLPESIRDWKALKSMGMKSPSGTIPYSWIWEPLPRDIQPVWLRRNSMRPDWTTATSTPAATWYCWEKTRWQ